MASSTAASYFTKPTGGQTETVLQFILDHGLSDKLPDRWVAHKWVKSGAMGDDKKPIYRLVVATPKQAIVAADNRAYPPIPDGASDESDPPRDFGDIREESYRTSIRASAIVDSFEPRFTGFRTETRYFVKEDENLNNEELKSKFATFIPITTSDVVVGTPVQPLAWPRQEANQNGVPIPVNFVPPLVCLATAHVVIRLANGQDPFGNLFTQSASPAGLARTELAITTSGIVKKWTPLQGASAAQEEDAYTIEDILPACAQRRPTGHGTLMFTAEDIACIAETFDMHGEVADYKPAEGATHKATVIVLPQASVAGVDEVRNSTTTSILLKVEDGRPTPCIGDCLKLASGNLYTVEATTLVNYGKDTNYIIYVLRVVQQ